MDIRKIFWDLYLDGKGKKDVNEEDVAAHLGYKSRKTLKSKRENPLAFTIGDLVGLAELFEWGPDEINKLLRSVLR